MLQHNIHPNTITVLDENTVETWDIKHISWKDYLDNLDHYDIIFKTPWIPFCEKLTPYQERITSQTQFFFDTYPWKVIAITASKGKSTISSLCHHILQSAGYKTKLVGNIGNPVLDEINISPQQDTNTNDHYDYVVYELSSYMLHNLKKKNYLSLLGSLFPDHLDWHGNMENYTRDKCNILHGSEVNIVHHTTIKEYALDTQFDNIISYANDDEEEKEKKEWPLRTQLLGQHNQENILWCIAIAKYIGIDDTTLYDAIAKFKGLNHRIEYVGTFADIKFYDDAISTTPESTIAAIKTLWDDIDTILLWGTDRGYDFSELITYLKKYSIKNVVLFPDSGKKIKWLLDETFTIFETEDMQEAVTFAFKNTKKWGICLLSTASPSYRLWKNFEEKGELFAKYVREYNW